MAKTEREDTAPIRTGEELDRPALEAYLRRHLPELMPGETLDSTTIDLEQFPGGHSNLTYLVRLGGHDFVLRRPPFGPVGYGWVKMCPSGICSPGCSRRHRATA